MRLRILFALCFAAATNSQAVVQSPQCISGANPGGGFDLTCRLARAAFEQDRLLAEPLRLSYVPGGIGAVAFNAIVTQRSAEGGTLVAFSSGSLLNIAQGKFGPYDEHAVRWVAAIGMDYGVIAVRSDGPYRSLSDLLDALKADPSKVRFGAGGTIGSQDWMKAALTARAAGVDHRRMRFVAFEGGGDALSALSGGHVHAVFGDASEMTSIAERKIRVLAVMAPERLPERLTGVPTAREQGYDVVWPIARGFYVGARVSDSDYSWWVQSFDRVLASPGYAKLRAEQGLFPFARTGTALDQYIADQMAVYRSLLVQFGVARPKR
jgi:putative tricarboxylic transport membrane protein